MASDALQGVEAAMTGMHMASAGLLDLATAFATVQQGLSQDIASMAQLAENTQMTVFGLFEHVQFSDICRQGLDRIRLMLDDIGDGWTLRVGPAPPGPVPPSASAPSLVHAS